jgi:DNA replication protein DnaC
MSAGLVLELPLAERRARYERAEAWRRTAARLGIPAKYRGVSFETVDRTKPVRAVLAYARAETYARRAMVLEGGTGTGKTTALCCYTRYQVLESSADDVRFYAGGQLITLLLGPTRDETLQAAIEADELVIDDLGVSYLKRDGLVVGLLEQLIIEREGSESPLLLSTNLPPQQFRAVFGERVYDRLAGAWGAWIDVRGPSLRGKPGSSRRTS